MLDRIVEALPARRGHFLLESGYHAELWLDLDALFVDPARIAPLVTALADKLQPYRVGAVCGPLLGGAFLAYAIATRLGVSFYYTEPVTAPIEPELFGVEYRLPHELRRRLFGQRVAIVDDVISAGSSVRATLAALSAAGAVPVVAGAVLILGDRGTTQLAQNGLPVECLGQRGFDVWLPAECPLCMSGTALERPR